MMREDTKLINKYIDEYIQSSNFPVDKSNIQDYINEFLNLFIEEGPILFQNQIQFTEDIQSLVIELLGRGMNEKFYRNVVRIFRKDLSTLLQDTVDGPKLVWHESIRCHLAIFGQDESLFDISLFLSEIELKFKERLAKPKFNNLKEKFKSAGGKIRRNYDGTWTWKIKLNNSKENNK